MSTTPSAAPRKTRWGLKAKLIVSMLVVGTVPLVIGLGMAFWQGSREIRDVSGESFKALAMEAARKLDLLVAEEIAQTARMANDPAIIGELEHRRDTPQNHRGAAVETSGFEAKWAAGEPNTVRSIMENPLSALLREYYTGIHNAPGQLQPQIVRASTKMLFLTDVHGLLVAAIGEKPELRHDRTRWWQGAYHKAVGRLFIEDIHFDKRVNAYVFTISVPVMDQLRYEVVGVLHRVIDAKEFFSPATHAIRFGKTGHVMLIDSNGLVISCPILPTGVPLSDPTLVPLVTPLQPGWVQASSDGHGGHSTSVIGFAPLPETSRATNGSIENGSWHTFVWQASDEIFAPIQHLFTWVTVFGAAGLLLLAGLGYFAASRIVTPVRQLAQAARAIGRGELKTPIDIRSGDELEELAEEFNRMNQQLSAAFAGLTDQVELKTREVQALQQSTDHILDAVSTPIFLIDADEQVRYVNRAARESFGMRLDQSSPMSLFDVLPLDSPARQRLRQEFRGDGTALAREQLSDRKVPRDPLAPAGDQEPSDHRPEFHIGSRLYHYQWFRLPARPGQDPVIGLVLRDTTDESRLHDQLVQAEKSGSLGVLTAGIGHELNNPLFGIIGLGEAIQEEQSLERAKAHARDIVAQGRRMATVIRDFAGVAGKEECDQTVPVSLEEETDRALAIVRSASDMKNVVVNKLYAGGVRVLAKPDQLQQALANLLTNAVQAMKGAGTLTLTTAWSDRGGTVTITDSGPGIPKQHLSKIFDPFFTTKGQGEGSGLGLTVARRIIRKFGGELRIESGEGRGTTCIVTLPAPPAASGEGTWDPSASQSESPSARLSP
ncbi:MAG: ATP-binding protein [Nitrospira sp.]|nr:ATP-binding protein [Nitrospira sp.]MCP9461774.1 ATP-binding protein [Nitrospira sp.]MCP9473731.1 ATP-binding protein [Nitrospira sp.]